jgi:hypothetical protein
MQEKCKQKYGLVVHVIIYDHAKIKMQQIPVSAAKKREMGETTEV